MGTVQSKRPVGEMLEAPRPVFGLTRMSRACCSTDSFNRARKPASLSQASKNLQMTMKARQCTVWQRLVYRIGMGLGPPPLNGRQEATETIEVDVEAIQG